MSNYEQRAATVERWVRSCETQEQIDLCKEAIIVFIIEPRNGENVSVWDKADTIARLDDIVLEMEKIVTTK